MRLLFSKGDPNDRFICCRDKKSLRVIETRTANVTINEISIIVAEIRRAFG